MKQSSNDVNKMLSNWNELYKNELINNIIPFWLDNKVDPQSGCLNNCVNDKGEILSKNVFIWSQGRALWTFSAIYNYVLKDSKILDIATSIYNYLLNNGRDTQDYWMFLLDENGKVLENDTSISVDGFVMNGMCEYYKATGNIEAADIAFETFETTYDRLTTPGSYRISPYKLPIGTKIHGINMMFSDIYCDLGATINRKQITNAGLTLANEILNDFYDEKSDAILEFIAINGNKLSTAKGRVCIPGHVLESMWFLIRIFERLNDKTNILKCCQLIKRHIELGWDNQYGGIQLAIDITGKKRVSWQKNECKPWWVQVEALVATLYAYKHTKDNWFLETHKKIQEYAFSNYPTPYGEWTQWLDKYGNKTETAALPVKDPCHLPRGLIYLIQLTNELKILD